MPIVHWILYSCFFFFHSDTNVLSVDTTSRLCPLQELSTFPEPEVVRKPQYTQTPAELQGVSASPEPVMPRPTPQQTPGACTAPGMYC